ncbi:hypothetical protein [Weissella confusa]|uniref:hypothetical protein n=1 Tax=Weissella confusa TaxID=1583 RepID=UPI002A75E4ED|nr:hypothetical protein [Weissella confusa]MDY2512780.1 hypothetical protein [Weissella confusa]
MTNDFLITLFSASEPRRHRVIFGLLKRQVTVSTEYWGLRYGLLQISGLMPRLDKDTFDARIAALEQAGLLAEAGEGQLVLTPAGQEAQAEYAANHYMPEHLSTLLKVDVLTFMQAFWLANQVVSEVAYSNKKYYPLQIDPRTMLTVKTWYGNMNSPRLVATWALTIQRFLQRRPQEDADRLVATWVGHETPGLNFEQLGFPATWTEDDFYFWQIDQYAIWSEELQRGANTPLKLLWDLVAHRPLLPNSVQASYNGVIAGRPMGEMVQSRRLKIGTIREHLLTAAIWLPMNDFPYKNYLTPDVVAHFEQHLTGPINDWEFSMVRTSDDPLEFFLFRLYEIYLTKQEEAARG